MRNQLSWLAAAGLAAWMGMAVAVHAQTRPYIGYAYPAGGKQGTTFVVKLGGQNLDDVDEVIVSGKGVTGKILEYQRRLSPQETTLLSEQLKELRQSKPSSNAAAATMMMSGDTMMMTSAGTNSRSATAPKKAGAANPSDAMMMSGDTMMMSSMTDGKSTGSTNKQVAGSDDKTRMMEKIDRRMKEYVQTPACGSIAAIVLAEITIASDAEPGERELRLATPRGVSNPLFFHVGQLPEHTRIPMVTCPLQILGKEAQALRKRATNEVEYRITLPCTLNGQIASSEVNRYRFEAKQGQKIVITTLGRQLIPYVADAVPGWFQPVLALHNASGKEVAYDDDYRFKPDPTILYEAPKDGEYVLSVFDSIYRGREDFIYRISIGELPFITSMFPLGGKAGSPLALKIKGWNLEETEIKIGTNDMSPGIRQATTRAKGLVSNRVPYAIDNLTERDEVEINDTIQKAHRVELPVIVNGRISRTDDCDVFQFTGQATNPVVVEVTARKLESPLDAVIKLTDARGNVLAFNDDREDLAAGINTHNADAVFMAKLPSNGVYYVHLTDAARKGGEEYAYRLRISRVQPDFMLRVVPSSISLRGKTTGTLTVHAARKDGFNGTIKLSLKDPPVGTSATPVTMTATQTLARLTIKSDVLTTRKPVELTVIGTAKIKDQEVTREAVAAEDRMQAFLWRHLVPARDLSLLVFDPAYEPPPKRVPSTPIISNATNKPAVTNIIATTTNSATSTNTVAANKPKFTKQQIAGRLRQLKLLFEEGLLTEDFYRDKVAECDTM